MSRVAPLRYGGSPSFADSRENPWSGGASACEDGLVTTLRADRSGERRDALPLLIVSGVVVAVVAGLARGVWLANLHNGLLALAFAFVGAYVSHQQPRNRFGWAFLATGVVEALMFLGRQIGHDPGPGASAWWGWVGVWPLVVGLALATLSVILFPDGTLPSPGWRWVIAIGATLTTSLAATAALWPVGTDAAGVVTPQPFTIVGVEAATDVWDIVARPTFVVLQVVWLVVVIVRWRTSSRVVRRQLTVVGAAVAVSLVALAVGFVGGARRPPASWPSASCRLQRAGRSSTASTSPRTRP